MSDFVEVPLTQGMVAIIDAADAEAVLAHKWRAHRGWKDLFYADRVARRPDGTYATEGLHTFLTGYALTDHRNGNGLDNRRANLREATQAQNARNRSLSCDNRSGFKGVSWERSRRKWYASIRANGRNYNLGRHDDPLSAARAYDAAARELHGEFARVNFPESGEVGLIT